MITLHNGEKLDFIVASGALGLDGRGYFWEKPFIWAGILDPSKFVITTKTLTFNPRRGNLDYLRPWRCIRYLGNGNFANAVGLTNPGYSAWIREYYPKTKGLKIIPSIAPETFCEGMMMANELDDLDIVAIEVNLSCPNSQVTKEGLEGVFQHSTLPIIIKLAHNQLDICRDYYEWASAFNLINSVVWSDMFDTESPFKQYGFIGGVSGPIIKEKARQALAEAKIVCGRTPIISGGGIDSCEEVYARYVMGARAFSFGTLFLRKPWLPNQIVTECRKTMENKNGRTENIE